MSVTIQLLVGLLTAVVTAGLAFAGAMLGQRLDYRRWHREETMRTLRWAVDRAPANDPVVADARVMVLTELRRAHLLQSEDRPFVEAVVHGVGAKGREAYDSETRSVPIAVVPHDDAAGLLGYGGGR